MGSNVALALDMIISLTTLAEHGIPAIAKVATAIKAANAAGRDLSDDEIRALAKDSDDATAAWKAASQPQPAT